MKAMAVALFLVFVLTTSPLYSQVGWYQQNSGTTTNLNGFCYGYVNYDTTYCFAVGDNGVVLKTSDLGANWNACSTPTSNNLYSVCSNWLLPRMRFWAAGANGTIIRTTNYGINWTVTPCGTSNNINSIHFWYSGNGFAVGDNGTFCLTTNAGLNWIISQHGNYNMNAVHFTSNGIGWAVGNNGAIYISTDQGQNWSPQISGTNTNLYSVAFNDMNFAVSTVLAVGSGGLTLKTTNRGATWFQENSGTINDLNSVCCSFNGWDIFWAAGNDGTILKEMNGIYNWIPEVSNTNEKLNSISFYDVNIGWAVGDNGTILHTETNSVVIDSKKFDANTISTWFRNNGSFNRNPVTTNAGFEWPKNSNKFARYASGPWIGAKVGNDTLVVLAEYDYEYYPGYTDNNGTPHGANDPVYRIYRLSYGINDSDRINWPNALLGNSNQGAPVYYDNLTHTWKPLDYGDQTMFYCYTDSYPESHTLWAGGTAPLKVDIKHLNFAFDEPGAMGNIIFTYYTIINKNTTPWIDAYFTTWTDDDLGIATDDLVGCDTNLSMGFTYNGTNHDGVYGDAPPAVAFVLIKGPIYFTGNNNDTAFICYGKSKISRVGYKQMIMTVFRWYEDAFEPINYIQSYRMMEGIDRFGMPILNPVTGKETKYMYSGDPVSNTGWIQQGPNDQRFVMSVGPFNMNPGDTQTIVIAQIIARGSSNLNSITVLRQYAQIAIDNYKNCFENVPIGIKNESGIPYVFKLAQNYPNPFNPVTKIKFCIPSNVKRETSNVKLIIYDVLGREVETILNQKMLPGNYEVDWDGSRFASGVYFYKLEAGSFVETKKMVLIK